MATLRVVTIDGPAGAGKSSVSRELARRLRFRFLDTGAMYRAVGLAALRAGFDPADAENVGPLAQRLAIDFTPERRVLLDGEDVTDAIRSADVTAAASACSAIGAVRDVVSRAQRQMGEAGDLVCEGRDMGTVVFPDAAVRIYLDASVDVRARRRQLELEEKGEAVDFETLRDAIAARDKADSEREIAPLKRIPEQTYVDTSDMAKDAVIDQLQSIAEETLNSKAE